MSSLTPWVAADAIAVSGSPPNVPVVSKTSGTVYEKALIERYIGEQIIKGEV